VFVLVTVSLSLGHAIGESRPAFFIIGASLLILAVVVAMQLNWMRLDKFDAVPRAKYATLALCLGLMTLSAALLAVVYEEENPTYSIGGSASNVQGGLVLLEKNSETTLNLNSETCQPFAFATQLEAGSKYDIQIKTPPPSGTCTVSGGTGTVQSKDVSNVRVTCIVSYSVGGRVSGLRGTLVLSLNGDRTGLTIDTDGSFMFDTRLADGSAYQVTVLTQPSGQTCTVTGGSGTINGADATGVTVQCG